jgi:hypothetical protein
VEEQDLLDLVHQGGLQGVELVHQDQWLVHPEAGVVQPFDSPLVVTEFIRRCNVSPSPTDVSPTENSLMLHPLNKVSLGYFAPDRTIPSL